MIAVMGASGLVGGKVAGRLLREGHPLRVLGRSRPRREHLARQGAEAVVGDASSRADLGRLFGGAEAALVLLPEDVSDPGFVATRERIAAALGDALGDEGVPHVVAVSAPAAAAGIGPGGGLRVYEQRLAALRRTNVLVLPCAYSIDNVLAGLPLIREKGINGGVLHPDRRIPMIATDDVAAVAAGRLARRDFTGHSVEELLGPGPRTMREATAAIGERLGVPDLPYVQFPPDEVRGALVASRMAPQVAALIVEMMVALNEGRLLGPDAAEGPPGRPEAGGSHTPTTLEAFLSRALAA